jgi:hypothetical protein
MNPVPWPRPLPPGAVRRAAAWKTLLLIAAGALFGAGIGAIVGRFAKQFGGSEALKSTVTLDLWTVALLPLAWWVVVLVHEVGHLLGGRLAGMRPLMLFAGPLHVDFGADRTRLRYNRVAGTFGGLAACIPRPDTSPGGYATLVVGGPLASALLAAIGLPGGLALGGWAGGMLFATGALSLLIGCATLLPLRAGGFMSDGGQLLGIARGDAETTARLGLATLMAQSARGVRPRDWDPRVLYEATAATDEPTMKLVAALLRATRAEDAGDAATAEAHWRAIAALLADPAVTGIADASRRGAMVPLAAWIATEQGDAAAARAWFEAGRGGFGDPAATALAEAAVRRAEGDPDGAARALDAARAALPRVRDRGSAIALDAAIDRLATRLDTNAPGTPAAAGA